MQVVHLESAHLNSPRVDEQVACPECSARAMLRQNGTIICYAERVAVIPEFGDKFFDMREASEALV
jgi:DNA-directed RNA polymerase subunit RPC12/RpoP